MLLNKPGLQWNTYFIFFRHVPFIISRLQFSNDFELFSIDYYFACLVSNPVGDHRQVISGMSYWHICTNIHQPNTFTMQPINLQHKMWKFIFISTDMKIQGSNFLLKTLFQLPSSQQGHLLLSPEWEMLWTQILFRKQT